MRRTVLTSAVVLLAVAALSVGMAASPQPTPICEDCVEGFERAAAAEGVNATVAESRVTVQVHENGSATWTIENRLSEGAAEFRDSPGRIATVGRSLRGEFVSASVEGDVVVLRLRDPDAAERHGGLLVVDYFHHGGYERWYRVNVEAFTIRGPEGTVVANDPASGEVDGRSVTWTGDTAGQASDAPRLEDYPYVVFGPDQPVVTSARATAILLALSAPRAAGNALPLVVVAIPVFAVALWLVGAVVRRRGPSVGADRLAKLVAAPGGLWVAVLVVLALSDGPDSVLVAMFFSGPPLFGLLGGALVLRRDVRRRLRTPRQQAFGAAAVLVAVAVVLTVLYALLREAGGTLLALRSTALALPFAAMLPLGGTLDDDGPGTARWVVAGALAFGAMLPLVANFAAPMGTLAVFFGLVVCLVAAVAFAVVGSPLVLLGRVLRDPSPEESVALRRRDL